MDGALTITPDELEDPRTYEPKRSEALRAMKRYKDTRRLALADDVSLLFEDRRTIRHQIQEMLRLEDDDEEAVESVFKHYADLMPNGQDLIATLFVEVREQAAIKPRLRDYARLERSLAIEIDGRRIAPEPQGETGNDAAATAVTYLRFPIPEDSRDRLHQAHLVVEHPKLKARFALPPAAQTVPE